MIKLAALQYAIQQQPTATVDYVVDAILTLAKQQIDLVILPELFMAPYFCQTEDRNQFNYAETIPGPLTQKFSALAKELKIVIVVPMFEKRAAGLYHNTVVVFERDGQLAGQYRKMHIPDDPGYYEKYYFTPGDLGFTPIATSVGNLGILICWDQWFPEAARLMTLAGADLLIYPTAIGWDGADTKEEQQRQYEAWQIVQRGHAVANGIPVVVCNRTGFELCPQQAEHGIDFWGGSFIAGPQGEIIEQAPHHEPHIITTQIDFKRTETVRQTWPFLRDRRIDAYKDLLKRFCR